MNKTVRQTLLQYLQGTWAFDRYMIHTTNGSTLGSVKNATAVFAPIDVAVAALKKEETDKETTTPTTTTTTTTTTAAATTTATTTATTLPQLLYREEGSVIFGPTSSTATPVSFYREYLYTFQTATSADVSFWRPNNQEEHLKFFHTLQVTDQGIGSTSEHLCIDDLYQATMKVSSDSAFSTTWVVDGPNKNYTITTEFTRAQVSTTTETDPYNGQ